MYINVWYIHMYLRIYFSKYIFVNLLIKTVTKISLKQQIYASTFLRHKNKKYTYVCTYITVLHINLQRYFLSIRNGF